MGFSFGKVESTRLVSTYLLWSVTDTSSYLFFPLTDLAAWKGELPMHFYRPDSECGRQDLLPPFLFTRMRTLGSFTAFSDDWFPIMCLSVLNPIESFFSKFFVERERKNKVIV